MTRFMELSAKYGSMNMEQAFEAIDERDSLKARAEVLENDLRHLIQIIDFFGAVSLGPLHHEMFAQIKADYLAPFPPTTTS